MSLVRSRWAAIGAALAVTLGAGGLLTAQAAVSPEPAAFVSVVPARVLDTREDLGLAGPFASGVGRDLTVTGVVSVGDGDGGSTAQEIVPAEATAIVANVTAVNPTGRGWVAVRPGDATGVPSTSSLNVQVGLAVPNSVTVGVDPSGRIELYYFSRSGGSVDLVVDIVGYYIGHDHDDRYYTETEIDGQFSTLTGALDTTFETLETDIGAVDTGLELLNTTKADAYDRIVNVSGAGTPSENGAALVAAIELVTAAAPTATDPWMIFLEPGTYEAASFPALPGNTVLAGADQELVTITDTDSTGSVPTLRATGPITVRDLTVQQSATHTTVKVEHDWTLERVTVVSGSGSYVTGGLWVAGSGVLVEMRDVSVVGDGSSSRYGMVVNQGATVIADGLWTDSLFGAVTVGGTSPTNAGVLGLVNSIVGGTTASVSVHSGVAVIDGSVLSGQINMGFGLLGSEAPVDVTITNTRLGRVFFSGAYAATQTRSIAIRNSFMDGGIVNGTSGLTSATLLSVTLDGTVVADTEVCAGVVTVTGPTFYDTTCP